LSVVAGHFVEPAPICRNSTPQCLQAITAQVSAKLFRAFGMIACPITRNHAECAEQLCRHLGRNCLKTLRCAIATNRRRFYEMASDYGQSVAGQFHSNVPRERAV